MATRMGIGAGSSRGIATGAQGIVNAPPTNAGNGSGGAGTILAGTVASVGSDVSDLMAGRLTLGAVGLSVVALIALYVWTRSAQGGG